MKIEQWVEQRYNWLNGGTDDRNYDHMAYVRLDKAIEHARQYSYALADRLASADSWQIINNNRRLIDLNYVLRCAIITDIAHDLLRKLIVWCAVYNEAV